jgi:hypothetical protein
MIQDGEPRLPSLKASGLHRARIANFSLFRLESSPGISRQGSTLQLDSDSENSALRMSWTCRRSSGMSPVAASQRICQSRSKYACTILCRTAMICRQGTFGWRSLKSTDKRLMASPSPSGDAVRLPAIPRFSGMNLRRLLQQSFQSCGRPIGCPSGTKAHAA